MLDIWKKIVDTKDYPAMLQFIDQFLTKHAEFFEKSLAEVEKVAPIVEEVAEDVIEVYEAVSNAQDPNMAPKA